eukprot:scaffold15419_cov206-Skeletonema_marinoi.AAC.16
MGGTSRKNKSRSSSRDHNGRSSSSNRNQRAPRDPSSSDQEKTPLVDKHSRESELHRAQNGGRQQKHTNGHRNRSKKQAQLGSFIGDNQKRRSEESNHEHVRLLDPTDSASVEFSLLTAPTAFMEDVDLQRHTNEEQNQHESYNHKNGRGNNPTSADEYNEKINDNGSNRRRRWFSRVKVNNLNSNASTGGSSNGSSNASTARMRTGVNNSNVMNNSKFNSGVKYRSATSTQRALDELKRKRMEAQEKKRALTILCLLAVVAFAVHFTNKANHAGGDGIDVLLRGSKDKEYGEVKDLGYGGERVPSSQEQQQLVPASQEKPSDGQVAGNNGAGGEDAEFYNTEYELPPPVDKIYDEEHKYLEPLRHFADVKDPLRPTDTAFFFHVPRAGGSTMKDIIGKCLKLVQSSEVGVRDGHDKDPMLEVLDVKESKYVNVDTTTVPGIQRAVDMGLAAAGVTDVIVSSYYHESAALFDLNHQGRAFMMMRNPIERAVSMYWHRVKEIGDLDAEITIEDYAQGNGIENNWMTRFMTNRMTGELTKDDMEQAKQILKEKFLIGLLDDLDETVYRIMKYNDWKFSTDETDKMKQEDCIQDLATVGSAINPDPYEIPTRGTQAYALITWQTQFDTKLFEYAKQLFDEQTKQWGTKERKKLLKKQKKKGN